MKIPGLPLTDRQARIAEAADITLSLLAAALTFLHVAHRVAEQLADRD
jgi:hypothetical protein